MLESTLFLLKNRKNRLALWGLPSDSLYLRWLGATPPDPLISLMVIFPVLSLVIKKKLVIQ